MQPSDKPTPDAFWKESEQKQAQPSSTLNEDRDLEVSQVKARFRHRLVGAVVIVAALVTTLPILFETPAIEGDKHALTEIPPIAKEPFYKMELPVNDRKPVSMPADASALKDLSKPNDVGQEEADKVAKSDTEVKSEEVAPHSYAPSTEGTLSIQVLATSSEAGAMREMARFQAMGLPVYSVKVQKKSATLWRVRLGLFKNREEAERVAKFLDTKKISHLPVQVEASAKKDINRIAPTRTLKSTVQEANAQARPVKAAPKAQPVKTPAVKKTASEQPKKAAQEIKKSAQAPKDKASVKKEVKKSTGAATSGAQKTQRPQTKPTSADPLGDLLKNTREEDIIAQKLREAARQ